MAPIIGTLIRAKWNGMKTALIAGDIQGALSYHHGAFRDRYASIYSIVGQDRVSALAQQMRGIEPVFVEADRAKYAINRDHEIDGHVVTITYFVYFSKEGNGLWKIERY